ncbi:MAG: anti-sigma factor [Alphaproteobacteria bacterium HGW-Alphaproteobacteria-17]|nr:MAG: anti-sigma factor [Alphaproteobacteria bacterium HGW-Alphaproteobacteria-17]
MSFPPDMIAAFVDGELDDLTARRIEREAASDPALAAEIACHRALRTRLAAHYAPIVEEPVPDRLRALLNATDDKVDVSLGRRRAAKQARFHPVHWGSLAAALMLGLAIGSRPWSPVPDVTSHDGVLVASGALEEALETRLASNQPADAAIRVGMTFRDEAGRICRSFESAAVDGIGCRENARWQLEKTLRGQRRGDYRQATSGELAAIAATMMAGDPLDEAGERAARDAKWRPR